MKTLYLIPFILCGCLSDVPGGASQPIEYIDLKPSPVTAVETPSPAPAVTPPKPAEVKKESGENHGSKTLPPAETKPVVTLYTAIWCSACPRHAKYHKAHPPKDFTVRESEDVPAWVSYLPCYHWNDKAGKAWVIDRISPEQFEASFKATR